MKDVTTGTLAHWSQSAEIFDRARHGMHSVLGLSILQEARTPMTSREARKERREQERKAAKLAYKAAKGTGEPIGFVSQKGDEHVVADPKSAQNQEPPSQPIPTLRPIESTRAKINRANARLSTGPRTFQSVFPHRSAVSRFSGSSMVNVIIHSVARLFPA